MAEFTPEAVRAALLAADFPEHRSGEASGFSIGDGRESDGEILVEYRRRCYGQSHLDEWTDADTARMRDSLWGYANNLRAAGYRAGVETRMVVITDGA